MNKISKNIVATILPLFLGLVMFQGIQEIKADEQEVAVESVEKTPSRGPAGEFTFVFNTKKFKDNTGVNNKDGEFTVKISDSSRDSAYKKATRACVDHYSNGQGASVGEDRFLDIIDICVNPY